MRRLINREPGRAAAFVLAALPFVLLIAIYLAASDARLAINPDDKLLPSPATLADSIGRLVAEPDRRSGDILLWQDTAASLQRLVIGLAIAGLTALCLGTAIGAIPHVRATLGPLVGVIAMIPPLAVLPILFITLGLGEVAKVALIVIGVTPVMVRDLAFRVGEIPRELILKAQTLGASTWQLLLRRRPADAAAAADPRPSPGARPRLALPHRGRGHRVHRGARLPHLPGPPLSRDGRHPALRRLDHPPRLHHGLAARLARPPPLRLV